MTIGPRPFDRSDKDLLDWVVKNPPTRPGLLPRWSLVAQVFGLGSTSATWLCRYVGADPDEVIDGGLTVCDACDQTIDEALDDAT